MAGPEDGKLAFGILCRWDIKAEVCTHHIVMTHFGYLELLARPPKKVAWDFEPTDFLPPPA